MKRFLSFICVGLLLLVTPAMLLARAGGGEGYSGGGGGGGGGGFGGGGGGGGGGDGDLFALLFWLCVRYPAVGIPLVLILIGAIVIGGKRGEQLRQTQVIRRGNAIADRGSQERAVAQTRATDPAFDPAAFLARVRIAFAKVQDGWSAQDLTTARPFVSDAIAERFTLQFEEQRSFGERNRLEQLKVRDVSVAGAYAGPVFDVLAVRIEANAIDTYVSIETGRHLRGLVYPQRFAEVWSFLRRRGARTQAGKPGLIEGNCPNCGGGVEVNQWAKCRHCGTLLRSGEFDWVLAEITQESEWAPELPARLPGVPQMREVDPDFNLQALEDRASVVFWRWAAAQRLGDVSPMRKVASAGWCDATAGELAGGVRARGARLYVGRCAVGAVRTLGVVHESDVRRAMVEVRWSGKHLRIEPGNRPGDTGRDLVVRSMLVFERAAAVRTDVGQSLSGAHCPSCGAPESRSNSNACDHCGTTLNRTDLGWVLVGWHDMRSTEAMRHLQRLREPDLRPIPIEGEPAPVVVGQAAAAMDRLGDADGDGNGAVHAPAELMAWLTKMVFADRQRHEHEERLLYRTAARHAVPREQVERLVHAAQDGILESPMPDTQEQGGRWLEAMAGMAVADGKVEPAEAKLLQSLAKRLGYGVADLNLMLRRQQRARYEQARERIRGERARAG